MSDAPVIRAIDLCAGAGGWACAARGLRIRIVAAIDRAADALVSYRHNHPAVWCLCGDVRALPLDLAALAGGIDLVLGGIPCEAISKFRRGWHAASVPDAAEIEDWRRTLDACLAIVKSVAPRWWIFEDVVEIIPHLPPLTPFELIDSLDYSGQRRQRCYVGQFPRPPAAPTGQRLRDYLRPGPHRLGRRALHRTPVFSEAFGADVCSRWDPDRPAKTIAGYDSRRDVEAVVCDGTTRRQLEWQECAAAQGWPADYTFVGSPTQVSKWIGQSVQIDTARALLRAVVREWGGGDGGAGVRGGSPRRRGDTERKDRT